MKVTEKIKKAEEEDRVWWSFEFFPPRTAQGLQNLYDRIERMRGFGPEFIDITWNAGGRSSDLTTSLVQVAQGHIGLETVMHITCVEKVKLDEALNTAKAHGCQNILALRGDPPAGSKDWTPVPTGFDNAVELVRYIRAEHGDAFCISVAGFPGGHPETGDSEEGRQQEMQWLKEKVEAGADFIFTQMFYDVELFLAWVRRVRAAGITVPIVPGIMPIQSMSIFNKWVSRENIQVPQHFYDALNPVKDDDAQVRAVGTKLVGEMCKRIITSEEGIRGLHIYTLNLAVGARMLLEEVGLVPTVEIVNPLPWTPSLTPARRQESIRPIFWSNRQKSYLSRTENWDEFPNGRWGDSRSPAYGEFDGYLQAQLRQSKETALEHWGTPEKVEDVYTLFSKFCKGEVPSLPWSEAPPSKEMNVINDQLARMNKLGFMTINSQPAVDGAPSNDKTHGWGPKNGYVYQKAYLEFFVSSSLLDELVSRIERDPHITYYAVNHQGDLRTNTHSEGPNAVTWGVFPGKEIVQPTIVEAVSFMAWKDEAFSIGRQWAKLYEDGSKANGLITEIMDEFYLVNVVHNSFKDPHAIFVPFLQGEAAAAPSAKTTDSPKTNGKTNGQVNGNGVAH